MRLLTRADAVAPGDRDTGLALAVILLTLRRVERAEPILAALARAAPDDTVVLFNLGQVRSARQDPDGALAAVRLAVALAPDAGEPLHSLGAAPTGIGFARQGALWLERALRFGAERVNWHRFARLAASPLCDGKLRARQMERLYRAVWRRRCAGLSP